MNIVSKVHHHIRHTRPKWYHHYHQWEHHNTLHWITFSLSTIVMLLGFVNAVMLMQRYGLSPAEAAQSGTTNVSQQVNAGFITINTAPIATLSAVTTSATAAQISTGSLGTVTVTDNRGSGIGWSATVGSSDFSFINAAVRTGGANGTVTSSGTYNSPTQGTYTINITTGGTLAAAKFSVSGLESATNQTPGSGVAIGTRGVTATFTAATYTTSDSWTIRVDTIPVTGFQLTPGTVTTVAGVGTNVTAGSAHTFTSNVDSTSLMSASSGFGMGQYTQNPSLQLSVPALTYANSYTATVTETVT